MAKRMNILFLAHYSEATDRGVGLISVNLSSVVCVDAWVRRGAWRFPSSISVFA